MMSRSSEAFQKNDRHYRELLDDLRAQRRAAIESGSPSTRARHVDAGKLLPRDRVRALLDLGSPFLEIALLAGGGSSGAAPVGAGIITGIGVISGRPCMIIANDSVVKGGTYHGMTSKKHVRAQEIAQQYRLPTITLVDSGGAFLPEMHEVFPVEGRYGTVFHQIVRQSAQGIYLYTDEGREEISIPPYLGRAAELIELRDADLASRRGECSRSCALLRGRAAAR